MIEIKEIQVGWNNKIILELEKLEIKQGQISVLLGQNGTGKSTLLKTIAGQIKPFKGEILIESKDIDTLSKLQIAQKLAYVSQFSVIPTNFNVLEFVSLGRNPYLKWWSWSDSQKDKLIVQQALELTNMQLLANSPIASLSGGERQRAMIALALAQESKYILFDEPTSHLDFKHQIEFLNLLNILKKQNTGILLVLHDLNLAAAIADQIILIKKDPENKSTSGIRAIGSVNEVLEKSLLKEVFDVDIAKLSENGLSSYVLLQESLNL